MQPEPSNNSHFSGTNNDRLSRKRNPTHISINKRKASRVRNKKTETITFRLESEILDSLRQESKRKDVSLNTLMAQIVRLHKNWHSIAAQAGFISVRKPLITKLLESQNEEEIKSLARHVAKSSNKDFILMLRREYNIHSALDIIETWVRTSGYSYTHNVKELDYSSIMLHIFIIQHNMGIKWSCYLAELYGNLFEEFGVRNAKFDMTDTTLAFDITVPSSSLTTIENNDFLGNNDGNGVVANRYSASGRTYGSLA
jgi:hypothetical protein